MTISETSQLTLLEISKQQAATSQHTYRWMARLVEARWGTMDLAELTRKQVQDWVNQRRTEVAPVTIRSEISYLRRLYRVAEDNGCAVPCPAHGLRLPRINNKRERILLPTERLRLRAEMGDKHYSLVEFAIQTGLRRLEQFRLRVEDVQIWEENGILKGWAEVRTSKTGKGRRCPLNPVAAQIALRWLEYGGPYLFFPGSIDRYRMGEGMAQRLRRACARLKIHGMRWHDLRHTAASLARQNGAALDEVQFLLGHETLMQTQRYVKYGPDHAWKAAMAVCKG